MGEYNNKRVKSVGVQGSELELRVAEMEAVCNRCAESIEALRVALSAWEGDLESFFRLMEYYESGQWLEDKEASEAGELPPDQPCGVLSEDTVYTMYGDMGALATDMLAAVLRWSRWEKTPVR